MVVEGPIIIIAGLLASLGHLGFYFGHGYQRINTYLNDIALITVSVVLLAGLGFFLYGTRKCKKI